MLKEYDYYDRFECTAQKPHRRCQISSNSNRCGNLSIERIHSVNTLERFHYKCLKGCYDLISYINLHKESED